MSEAKAKYPKRIPFFALKFCRLIGKICLANEIGAEASLLLINIALVEDAKSYRSAVTYFNEQLMPLVGVNSHRSLINVRNKAIAAGWLHYEPGGKGFAGKYWVLTPPEYGGMDDLPTDENPAEYRSDPLTKSSEEAKRKRSESVEEVKRKRSESVNHSSLSCPVPDPREESPTVSGEPPAVGAVDSLTPAEPKKPRAEPTGPAADARRDFCARWKARYRSETEYGWDFGKDGKSLQSLLKIVGEDAAKLAPIFARYFADDDPFHAAGSRHSFGNLKARFPRWQADLPPPSKSTGFKTKREKDQDHLENQFENFLNPPEFEA